VSSALLSLTVVEYAMGLSKIAFYSLCIVHYIWQEADVALAKSIVNRFAHNVGNLPKIPRCSRNPGWTITDFHAYFRRITWNLEVGFLGKTGDLVTS
jgi:hypothetical protein